MEKLVRLFVSILIFLFLVPSAFSQAKPVTIRKFGAYFLNEVSDAQLYYAPLPRSLQPNLKENLDQIPDSLDKNTVEATRVKFIVGGKETQFFSVSNPAVLDSTSEVVFPVRLAKEDVLKLYIGNYKSSKSILNDVRPYVVDPNNHVEDPKVSPNLKWIAFKKRHLTPCGTNQYRSVASIWIGNPRAPKTFRTLVSEEGCENGMPVFSSDGTKISFVRECPKTPNSCQTVKHMVIADVPATGLISSSKFRYYNVPKGREDVEYSAIFPANTVVKESTVLFVCHEGKDARLCKGGLDGGVTQLLNPQPPNPFSISNNDPTVIRFNPHWWTYISLNFRTDPSTMKGKNYYDLVLYAPFLKAGYLVRAKSGTSPVSIIGPAYIPLPLSFSR